MNKKIILSPAFSPEVKDYERRIISAGGGLSKGHKKAINAFVKAAKQGDYWNNFFEIGPMAGTNLVSAQQKLKYIATSALINTGFVEGDYSAIGVHGGGTGKWFDTNTTWASLANGGLGGLVFFQSTEAPNIASYQVMIGVSSSSTPQMAIRWDTNYRISATFGATNSAVCIKTNVQSMSAGLHHLERSALNSLKLYNNGVLCATNTTTITANEPSSKVAVLSQQSGVFPCIDIACGFWAITNGGFSDTKSAQMAIDVQNLMYDLGRFTRSSRRYNHIPIIGQSLAAGGGNPAAITTTPAYENKMYASGELGGNPTAADPTVWTAADLYDVGNLYPLKEITYETPGSAFANLVSSIARANGYNDEFDSVIGNWAVGGTAYSGLKKTTNPYNNSIKAYDYLEQNKRLYTTNRIATPAIICIHGESDYNSATYQTDIRTWQSDYKNDIVAKTGQTDEIPMFHSQPSSWTATTGGNSATALSAYAILDEHETNPTKTLCVGPKYFLPYNADGVHLTAEGYQRLGEYYAKAYYQHVVQGQQWEPLRPSSIVRTGADIDITFAGVKGSLTLDAVTVTDPSGSGTYGFEYVDNVLTNKYTSISSVTVTGTDTVRVTLVSNPDGNTGKTLRYAYTGTAGQSGGPTTGPRGCLRDTDTTITSLHSHDLFNWCVHFTKSIN